MFAVACHLLFAYAHTSAVGTILEATKTVTGFSPDSLLMTSAYDAIHDEDLPGFLCVKTQFWDKGQPDVEVYLRRRNLEGEWLWLKVRAVSYVSQPVPGVVLREAYCMDQEEAKYLNRITRVTAILVQAVEAARIGGYVEDDDEHARSEGDLPADSESRSVDKKEAYESLIDTISATRVHMPDQEDAMLELMRIAQQSLAAGDSVEEESKLEKEIIESVTSGQKKKFDPFSVMESVRKGVRLDLGLTKLELSEIKLITLVLTGRMPVEDVAPLVLHSLKSGTPLEFLLRKLPLDCEKHQIKGNQKLSHQRSSVSMTNESLLPPPVTVLNVSYTYIGNHGVEMLTETLYREGTFLQTLDLSFCSIDEKGFLSLARALAKRKRKRIKPLKGIILSGNTITARAAGELGTALAPSVQDSRSSRQKRSRKISSGTTGYDSDEYESDSDEDDDFDNPSPKKASFSNADSSGTKKLDCKNCDNQRDLGLQVLYMANTSMSAESLTRLLDGLGVHSTVRELNLSSNNFGASGAGALVQFLEGQPRSREHVPMPFLDRLDMSNNSLGDDGTTQLTRAISKRSNVHLIDLKLSSNGIGPSGVETIMNKLLQHNLVSLSLDKNGIGDQGCQLVAASLQTMKSLAHLNLSFNQIGSRGINSLMRSLIACDSVTYLGLSGNILKISGAMALAFTLAQHPRLEELEIDNCCLGQAAQCHIVAGIISNRWVPMNQLSGFAVGPPMVAIGALKPYAQHLSNEECFRIRKDEQMKIILQWMQNNRQAKKLGLKADPVVAAAIGESSSDPQFLTPDLVARINELHGTPSQNAYFRLLSWLSRIPFDDDELTSLQKFFYDTDGGEGDRGSDGYINLKLRGDLLAALDSEVADEIRDELPALMPSLKGSIGLDLDKLFGKWDSWKAFQGDHLEGSPEPKTPEAAGEAMLDTPEETGTEVQPLLANGGDSDRDGSEGGSLYPSDSVLSASGKERKLGKVKPRITMFGRFEQQLEELKSTATDMIEMEEDPMQHEIILTQYAEASLTILRQLKYHCMNSGLDGWRQGGLKRKVLVIDDSNVTRKLVSRAFEKANFIVDTASNGAEGVEKLKASIYDIAFMDIDMPVMNGFEATKKLREWEDKMRPGARQPICALTATYVNDFERSQLMKFKEAGLDVMESKPCNMPRLFKVVDDVSPMFSDLSISVIQREKSDSKLSDKQMRSDIPSARR